MTIKEIAQMAGVSTATVSKVLNGKDEHISDGTRNKIMEIVERENYRPNRVAKSLKMKRTETIGIIVPDIMNLFFSEMAKGIEDAADKEGFSVILCNTNNSSKKEENYIHVLQEKMVDGIILTTSENNVSKYLEKEKVPIVLLDRNVKSHENIGRILIDNKAAGYNATKHLIDKGCKKIGFISSTDKNYSSYDRFTGYKEALQESNFEIDHEVIYTGQFNIDTGYKGALKLMESRGLDGIFCGDDYIAIGAVKAIKEKNKKIPDEIKVVGFDDISIVKYMEPALTTIKQPIYELGREAVRMLISIINNKETEMTKILKTELVERGTS